MSASPDFDRLRVVLVRTRNPLNLGAAARAMSNFGFTHLRLVKPFDAGFREARSAVGAAEVLTAAEQFERVAHAVADCTLVVGTTSVGHRELQHRLRTLSEAGQAIRKRLASGPVALLFGSEKVGLSKEDLDHCHWLLRIPTCEAHRSMNLGQAVAVCLYELRRGSVAARLKTSDAGKGSFATADEIERLSQLLRDVLRASGYEKPNSAASTEAKIRRVVRRLNLREEDAKTWLGMLRQIEWKLKSQN